MKNLTNRPCFWLGIAAIFAVAVPLAAHIVPPEEIHPVAESYRRSGFVLGLNPVLWDQVQTDANVIAAGLEIVDPERAAEFVAAIDASIARGRVGEADSRRAESDEIFVLTTRAVASLISQHLERARSAIERGDDAVVDLEEARQLWAAFEREIRYTDGASYVRLGRCWLELYAALGNPGLGGMSGLPADAKTFAEEAAEIVDYLDESYVDEPRAARPSKLAVPANSPTYDGNQTLPPYLPPTSEINKQLPRPRQVLNMAERGVDETETTLIALGDMVFDSPEIFGDPARSLGLSCNSCHNKSITNPNLFVPGLSSRAGGIDVDNAFFAPHANDGVFDPLDIPDLRGIRFTAPYGRDGRFDSLREFSRNVIVNEFNGAEPEPEMLDGLIAYMLQFDFLPNPLLNDNGTLTPDTPEIAR